MILWNWPKYETYQNSRLETAGNYEEITLATFKQWLKWEVSDTSEDTIMTACLKGAMQAAERYTGRVISRSTWRTYLNGFNDITFDVAPADTFVVNYYDATDTEVPVDPSNYVITNNGQNQYGSIRFTWNTVPELYSKDENVYIEFQAGYSTIPDDLQIAILKQAADDFETRTNDVSGSMGTTSFGFHQKLFPYKML